MKNLDKVSLAIDLIKMKNINISNEDLVLQINNEFNINCTLNDIDTVYASRYIDNFEIQSKSLEVYGEYIH